MHQEAKKPKKIKGVKDAARGEKWPSKWSSLALQCVKMAVEWN